MTIGKAKRFYKTAAVAPAEGGGFAVTLDGKPIRTPAGTPFAVPSLGLAEAIATEWGAQGDTLQPHTMPLMQLASTALDRVGPRRDAVIDELLNYAATDLLCYRAAEPAELAERQQRAWQPLLDWAARRFAAELSVTTGIVPVTQPEPALAALRRATAALDDWRLTALQSATAAAGSLVVALAMLEGEIDADKAFVVAFLDEIYQAELWGDDYEAEDRRDRLRADLEAAQRFARLSG